VSGARELRRAWLAGGERHAVEVRVEGDRLVGRVVGPEGAADVDATAVRDGDDVLLRTKDGLRRATVLRRGGVVHVAIDGDVFALQPEERAAARDAHHAEEPHAASPMTGTVVKVAVAPGAAVAKGGPLFVVEAMKMEYVVKAPRDVVVAEVRAAAGAKVTLGQVVVLFREEDA
jgi:acetyl/propionyl-CoA carboxylase alpha subunit